MRITKKYFRDAVNRSLSSALAVLPEIVKRYGKNPKGHRKMQEIRVNTEMGWNHCIDGFYFYNNNLFIDVYWQGPDTDGNDSVRFVPGRSSYRIPAEHYDDGIRTRMVHSDINIDSDELYRAIKILVNSL